MTRGAQRSTSSGPAGGPPNGDGRQAALRALPSVEEARLKLEERLAHSGAAPVAHALLVRAIRATLHAMREEIRQGGATPTGDVLVDRMLRTLALQQRP